MNLNSLIIGDVGKTYTALTISYIKIMILFVILLVVMLIWSHKHKGWHDTFKAPIRVVVIIMVLLSTIHGLVLYNHKDKDDYRLQIIDTQTKEVLSSKSITKEDGAFIKGLKLKYTKGEPISNDENKKLKLIIKDMKIE